MPDTRLIHHVRRDRGGIMNTVHQPLALLGKVICFGAFGVVALFVLAPVLALVGMLLAFAGMVLSALFPLVVIGLLIWAIQYLLYESRPVTRPLFRNCAAGTLRGGRAVAAGCCRSAGWLLERSAAFVRQLHTRSALALEKVQNLGWRVGGVALETVCGGVLLGSLAGLTKGNIPGRMQDEYVGFAILAGLAVGLMVGLANYSSARNCQQE
jgi:hypothetical protein